MASRNAERDRVLGLLKEEEMKTIVLTGDAGVGKTWIAKEISDSAISKDLSYMVLWVFLNQRQESKSLYQGRSLLENIARQLCVLSAFEEWKDNDSKDEKQETKEKTEEQKQEEECRELKKKISDALEAKRSYLQKKNEKKAKIPEVSKEFLLLILDGIPDEMNEDDILTSELKVLLQLNKENPYRVLITRRKELVNEGSESMETSEVREIQSQEMKKEIIKIEPLSKEEGLTLFKRRLTDQKVKQIAGFETRAEDIFKKSEGLPPAIIMIAEALNRIGEQDPMSPTLEGALKEGADDASQLLCAAYDMLSRSDLALIKCWWHSLHFFITHGGVHYDELISCWILEGCVGTFELIEKANDEGHRVLMGLIDCQMLKMQDDNIVVMGELALKVPKYRQNRYEATSSLGLASVFEGGGDWQNRFGGRITQADGMIKTPSSSEKLKNSEKWKAEVSTLLIDGSRLYREVRDKFFDTMRQLEVLAIFNPTFRVLPSSLSEMGKLRLLVLRGCDPLENIDPIKELKSLIVLEISGAASLKNIPDADFFKKLDKLRSLNLSAAQIDLLPSSISDLSELRWLILRGCSSLETLPRLKKLKNLEMLDLSGASELKNFEDVTLKSLEKLRMLDISETQLGRLPILGSLENLTRLSLRCCVCLPRLSMLKALSHLQILDLSGAVILKEIPDESLHQKLDLKTLHLTGTLVSHLPFNFDKLSNLELLDLSDNRNLVKIEDNTFKNLSCLHQLDLSKTKIENLPSLFNLGSLEFLNLSGCESLTKIGDDDQAFQQMTRLQRLNLSESSKIESLPSLSKLVNLRQLLLSNCTGLKQLPSSLESLSKLEQLDLNACSAKLPEGTTAEIFLKNMKYLQLLNLSGTGLALPPLSNLTNLTNLTQLSLGGCSLSESEPNLGNHTKLEVLDLSEITKITSLLSLGKLSSLRKLKLRGCSGIKKLPDLELLIHLEVLDLWGTGIEGLPYEIFELTSLKHLDLPDMSDIQKLEWEKIKRLPEEVNWVECRILKHCRNGPCISLSPTQLSKLLKDNPDQLRDLGNAHIFVSRPLEEEQRSGGDIFWHRVDPSLRKVYLTNFSVPKEDGLFLEIVGLDSFPEGIEGAIVQAKYVSLIGNKFIKSLSDLAAGLKAVKEGVTAPSLKGCIVEKCIEMETIFGGEETEVKMRENLETLKASNLPKLKSVVSIENEKLGGFQNLRKLYLDCCPLLQVVFPSSQQQPENLEILEIKFCDELKTLFNPEAPTECKLKKLQELHLLELPEYLTSIGVSESKNVTEIFPSLKLIKFGNCPNMIDDLKGFPELGVEIEEYRG